LDSASALAPFFDLVDDVRPRRAGE
jgi:hypothetical protein